VSVLTQSGQLPLHHALEQHVGLEVVKALLLAFPDAVSTSDKVHCGHGGRCVSLAYVPVVCVCEQQTIVGYLSYFVDGPLCMYLFE